MFNNRQGLTVMVVGSGGREHALAWAFARSWRVKQVYVAPGNGGTQWAGAPCVEGFRPYIESTNVDIAAEDVPGLVAFAQQKQVDLVVVGPEVPLANGITDAMQAAGVQVFGPTQAAARIESSKAFAKQFMQAHGIPTARFAAFDHYNAAAAYIHQQAGSVVVKADGLAAGKGVFVCDTLEEALAALDRIMGEGAFGEAGAQVLIEERLTGPEVSLLAFSDGQHIAVMPPARDYKRALDGDEGPNTGGMGAFAPLPELSAEAIDALAEQVLQPVVKGLAAQGTPYIGVLYAGLMLTPDGPKVLEYNCRFGDPETQVILPLLMTDITHVVQACVDGKLDSVEVKWSDESCATVVMAAPGYPGAYPKDLPISGLESVGAFKAETLVFQAGTRRDGQNLLTHGGRVLAVSGLGDTLDEALERAYAGVKRIRFEGAQYRSDIGKVIVHDTK